MVLHSEDEKQDEHPLVVGIGASAGGHEALSAFFEAMPDAPGMAFVVIIQLSSGHESSVGRVLQGHTSMAVRQVTGRTPIEADHIYIIPRASLLTVKDRHLVLAGSDENNKQLTTIDQFFRSLGKAQKDHSACIILSGTGSGGSIGLKTIKEYGGIVITQESEEAGYDDMPRGALQTGMVDLTLPVKEIPVQLMNYKKSLEQLSIEDLHHRLLFKQYEPASVIINAKQEVLHATSDIDRFLKYSGGEPSQDILKMVVPELRKVLSRLLFRIKQDDRTFSSRNVRFDSNGTSRFCKMIVRKIVEPKAPEGLIHIIFMEFSESVHKYPQTFEYVDEESNVVAALEKELEYTREQLNMTIQKYETSNEELHASNEELQSMNEELRSTTEQLETSKEELQSVNEELKSVNTELERKIEKLDEANSNFKNLMEATEIATIFVDGDNLIQFYTETATELFNLIPADVGRSFKHITHQLNYNSVSEDIDYINKSLETIKKVVPDEDGRQYIMRIRPYRTVANKIDGVVLTFVDITQLKKVEEQLTQEVERSTRLQQEILSNSLSERWELGAYLHDNLGQILVSIKILVNEVKAQLSAVDNRGEMSSTLTGINELIDVQIENIRNVSHDIIPIDVEEEGISHAFRLLMRRSQEIHGINCTLKTNGILNRITNRELSTHLYHITQESIKNAAVHGKADRIFVGINEEKGQLCLEVNDNGIGFSSAEKDSEGMGLRIMKHRVELMGGTFTIKTQFDSEIFTTGIRCTFPIESVRLSPEGQETTTTD